ncbi:MAG: hypothetical protein FWC06_01150 [Treponema sp.]|nr:hypothetical protein [Treponema sp.]
MKVKLAVILACVYAFVFLAGCADSGSTNNKPMDNATYEPLVFESIVDGQLLEIIISRTQISRATIEPKAGDYYMIILGNKIISQGSISAVSAKGEITFTPSGDSPGPKEPFTGIINPGDVVSAGNLQNGGKLVIDSLPYEGGVITDISASPKGSDDQGGNDQGNSGGQGTAGISLTAGQITDIAPFNYDINIILSRSNTGFPVKETIYIDNPSEYDFIMWEITGVGPNSNIPNTSNASFFRLDATDVRYNSLGGHILVLTVSKDGFKYQRVIPFTIIK